MWHGQRGKGIRGEGLVSTPEMAAGSPLGLASVLPCPGRKWLREGQRPRHGFVGFLHLPC